LNATFRGGRASYLAFPQAPAEHVEDEIRQLELLGQAIATAFRSTLVEPLPHEIALILNLLELKEKEKVKPMTLAKLDKA
jgi:hypothetical protein